jgi:hypothetical protein
MLQYLPAFKLPNGNAAFGERRLPEIAPLGFAVNLMKKIL